MILEEIDMRVIQSVLGALATGIKRAENETPDGRKVTGYYITDKQIRIDIVEAKEAKK